LPKHGPSPGQHLCPIWSQRDFHYSSGAWNGATAGDAANFIHNYGTSWVYVYDSSGNVFSNYGVNSTPTFFVIGKDGSIVSNFTGEQSASTLSSALSAAINT